MAHEDFAFGLKPVSHVSAVILMGLPRQDVGATGHLHLDIKKIVLGQGSMGRIRVGLGFHWGLMTSNCFEISFWEGQISLRAGYRKR